MPSKRTVKGKLIWNSELLNPRLKQPIDETHMHRKGKLVYLRMPPNLGDYLVNFRKHLGDSRSSFKTFFILLAIWAIFEV